MTFQWPMSNLEIISLSFFVLCFLASALVKYFTRQSKAGEAAVAVRSRYKRSWANWAMNQKDVGPIMTFFRNHITISSSLIGGLVIAFGLIVTAFLGVQSTPTQDLHLVLIVALLSYALLNLLIEVRTLLYLPVLIATPGKLIKKYEKRDKKQYIGRLLDHAYDDFSNAERSLFYILVLLLFFINMVLFMFGTLVLTYLMVRRDLSPKSRISIY